MPSAGSAVTKTFPLPHLLGLEEGLEVVIQPGEFVLDVAGGYPQARSEMRKEEGQDGGDVFLGQPARVRRKPVGGAGSDNPLHKGVVFVHRATT
jgi:hypothetical protein